MTYTEPALISVTDQQGDEILNLFRTYEGAPDQALGHELAWIFNRTEICGEVRNDDIERSRGNGVLISCGLGDFATDLVTILNGRKPYGQDCWPRLHGLHVYPPLMRGVGEVWEFHLSLPRLQQLHLVVYCAGQRVWSGAALNFNPRLSTKWREARAAYLEPAESGRDQTGDPGERHDAASDRRRHGDSPLSSRVLDFAFFKRKARHTQAGMVAAAGIGQKGERGMT